jgi:hypothetical protein
MPLINVTHIGFFCLQYHWLPSNFNCDAPDFRRTTLMPMLNRACGHSGCAITSKKSKTLKFYTRLEIGCVRYRKYKQYPNKDSTSQQDPIEDITVAKKQSTNTKKPTKEEDTCKFNLCVFYHHGIKRWFFPKEGGGNASHNGHPRLPYQFQQTPISCVSKEDIDLAVKALTANIPTAAIKELLRSRSKVNLSTSQLRQLRLTTVIGKEMLQCSPAERLIHNLKSNPDMSFCMLTALKEVGSDLIRIKKTAGGRPPVGAVAAGTFLSVLESIVKKSDFHRMGSERCRKTKK